MILSLCLSMISAQTRSRLSRGKTGFHFFGSCSRIAFMQGRRRRKSFRSPLFRLLAINLAGGVALAVFLVGGLLWLDPGGLRHLIFTDRSPGVALGLLLFGFVVTLGSTAMGSAIMALGQRETDDDLPGGPPRLSADELIRTTRP